MSQSPAITPEETCVVYWPGLRAPGLTGLTMASLASETARRCVDAVCTLRSRIHALE